MSPKVHHEMRDPVHGFIEVSSDERRVIDSRPLQRLRRVRQLALTSLLYPGASHSRFEHSLGTMHLASRVFDVITRHENVSDQARALLPDLTEEGHVPYWRSAVRMAALCHDIGHLPFSHAAEHRLLPEGWTHEALTWELIVSDEMASLFNLMTPPLRPEDVARLAVGKRKAPPGTDYSLWEEIISEIVVGDAFGVDRMDYLLRDSLHAGVEYGKFDHHRLTGSLRILQGPLPDSAGTEPPPPTLGVEEGGLHSAEQMLLARYFMFSQMYLHPIRRVYDLHLINFLESTLAGGKFSVTLEEHLRSNDDEVFVSMSRAAADHAAPGFDSAKRIIDRQHFKRLYEKTLDVARISPEIETKVASEAQKQFGDDAILVDSPEDTKEPPDFPVLEFDGRVVSSATASDLLKHIPVIRLGYVFVDPEILEEARGWLEANRAELEQPVAED
jgi:uncharacterized protein